MVVGCNIITIKRNIIIIILYKTLPTNDLPSAVSRIPARTAATGDVSARFIVCRRHRSNWATSNKWNVRRRYRCIIIILYLRNVRLTSRGVYNRNDDDDNNNNNMSDRESKRK